MAQQTVSKQPSTRFMRALDDLFAEYSEAVEASPLSAASKVDYVMFAEHFVRWLNDDFTPGGSLS